MQPIQPIISKVQYVLHILGNLAALSFICIALLIALKSQILGKSLPCPLCYMQRVAYVSCGLGLAANLLYGPSMLYYGTLILSAALGIVSAGRQVFLHILPGDAGFGERILNLSAYTWNVIIFFAFILASAIALLLRSGFKPEFHVASKDTFLAKSSKVVITIFVLLILINVISSYHTCGFSKCVDNPVYGICPIYK